MKAPRKTPPAPKPPRAPAPHPAPPLPAPEPPPPSPGGERDLLHAMEQMLRTFRTKASIVCPRSRLNVLCTRTATKLQNSYPGFDPSALTVLTAPAVIDMLESILRDVPWWHRRVLRIEAVRLLAELYNTSYDALCTHGMLERVEQLYLSIKD